MFLLMFIVPARKCGYFQTANRILTLQYELTDRLIYFINNKQPGTWLNVLCIIADIVY